MILSCFFHCCLSVFQITNVPHLQILASICVCVCGGGDTHTHTHTHRCAFGRVHVCVFSCKRDCFKTVTFIVCDKTFVLIFLSPFLNCGIYWYLMLNSKKGSVIASLRNV